MNIDHYLRTQYSFKVYDTPIRTGRIQTEKERMILHRIMARSSNNKLILVNVSSHKGGTRTSIWIKFGSPLAMSFDPKHKMRLW